jgi:hypothetical protein
LVAKLAPGCAVGCDHALENAIITPTAHREATLMAKLDAVMSTHCLPPP